MEPPDDGGERFCPLCGRELRELDCPDDGVHTVPADILDARHMPVTLRGRVLAGRFRVGELIGEGAMGQVYRGVQTSVGREVAIKTLHPSGMRSREDVLRFFREARAASRMRSAHVVQVVDFGFDEATRAPFIAMEYMDGPTLREVMRSAGTLSVDRACRLLGGVAEALAEAESLGVVHRDLKPDNILVAHAGQSAETAKVTDFGVAKLLNDVLRLTMSGAQLGTPAYMPPEQIEAGVIDHRSDLYALGCMLHEALVGKPPFDTRDVLSLLRKHLTDEAPDLPDPLPNGDALPPELAILHRKMLAKSPADRPESATHVAEVLARLGPQQRSEITGVEGAPTPAPLPRLLPWLVLSAAIVLGACILAGTALWLALSTS